MTTAPFGIRAERLAPHTSLRIGGPADFFLRVASERDLAGAIVVAREHELPVFLLGGGTNLLVADEGVRGVVLQNGWSDTKIDGPTIDAASGTPLAQPNTGSIFRNPPGDHAGRLIEAAGLKGARIGGAIVSEKHANFIVNTGEATAADVKALMERCRREVLAKFGVQLVPEVELVGDW